MLNAAENKVKIEGILSEIDINYGEFKKNGSPMKSIGGSIKVRVNQTLPDGTAQELEIPVHMFASELTNKGTSNPAYESIERIKNEYVSIAASDIQHADCVRITSGSINMNEYYGQNGNLVSFPRIQASFVTKIKREDMKPEATFSVSFQVGSMGYVTDADGVEDTTRFKIGAALPQYGGKVDVVPFYATSPSVIEGVKGAWNVGDSVKANGRLNFTSRTEVTHVEVDFGEGRDESRTISVSELIITGGSASPLEGEFAFDSDEITAGLKDRQARLEASKEAAKNKTRKGNAPAQTTNAANKYADLGF